MGRGAGAGFARHALAAVVTSAALASAACGSQHAGSGGSAPQPSTGQIGASDCTATPAVTAGHTLSFRKRDDGKVVCVARGATVGIYLQGTPARRWSPIRTASPALKPVPNGRLMLKVGVTGAFFKAVSAGVATVTSSRPGGPAQSFRLTLVVTR
jgi:hypothetical protein